METLEISMGETILFALLAVSMVIVAIFGLLITRRAVYTVISVIFVMVGFAFLYTMLEAPFMGVAQVVVYTGAILMMFLFVLMLIGVDSADSGHETLKAQRPVAILGGLGMLAIMTAIVFKTTWPDAVGLEMANAQGNPMGVARLIFSNHVLTLELTGTLLIVAALGAMTLTHRDRVAERQTQEELAHKKMQDFVEAGVHPGQLPNPGVYAESNSSTNPALTAYGQPLENSVNRVLKIRGQERRVAEISPETVARITRGQLPSGPSTYGQIGRATIAGMPGEKAPDHEAALKRFEGIESASAPETLESALAEIDNNAQEEN
ncbi:NADH-quinone oxidoreductase subunit J [Arcanobacterium ihumii]|uniref:NADH-quinone oxidoreductase subunit J n=1 Tax=Arcanobacterium ihumii TaxID=2138162 RepID=UPI000F539992|nr:NADH-quinone oxidoreductase subunit J [Arcanobacterium ihumii]